MSLLLLLRPDTTPPLVAVHLVRPKPIKQPIAKLS
jgi:hypothetical protein